MHKELLVYLFPESSIAPIQIGNDQIVLRRKAAIQADLHDAGLHRDFFDADTWDAAAVQQSGSNIEQLFTCQLLPGGIGTLSMGGCLLSGARLPLLT